jgi:sugar-phosphatase
VRGQAERRGDVAAAARQRNGAAAALSYCESCFATDRLLQARLRAAGLPQPERLISANMVTHGKPDPEPYLLGAERLGVAAKDCLVFEDAPSGVKAGVAAGCSVVGVLGTTPAETLRGMGATWIVASLAGVRAEVGGGGLRVEIETA